MITNPEEHDINRAGKRLLRETLEPLKWVVNDVQEDYGIDSNVQVFDGLQPTGAWFHVQLKSSASSDYSANGTFVSQDLRIHHARHYALEMRDPIFLIHADVSAKRLYWHAPQLDHHLADVLAATQARFIRIRIPTRQLLPETAPDLLARLNEIYLVLGNRTITSTPVNDFAASLTYFPDQAATYRTFQEKADTLKVQRIFSLFHGKKYPEARDRAEAILRDPDSAIEAKFWVQMTLQSIDYSEILHSGKPQAELSKSILSHARRLQKLTKSGPKYLKFHALITRQAAELQVLVHEQFTLFMALQAHVQKHGNPMLAIQLYAKRCVSTRKIVSKYNQCVRLARYAANYPDRWMLGRALANIPRALGPYMITLRAECNSDVERAFAESAIRIAKLAVWICRETGDTDGVVLAIASVLAITESKDSGTYVWAAQMAERIADKKTHDDALALIERAAKRWTGGTVEGDYKGNTSWQVIQNMATALGIDVSDENDPLVCALKLAAKDDSPERILRHCEHLLVTRGATGPVARRVQILFNTTQASSKVIHCTLHDHHFEGKEQDLAYDEFKRRHCNSCPDTAPRANNWRLTREEEMRIRARNRDFVIRLIGTPFEPRFAPKD